MLATTWRQKNDLGNLRSNSIRQNAEALPNENDVVITELGMAKAVTNFQNTIRTYSKNAQSTRLERTLLRSEFSMRFFRKEDLHASRDRKLLLHMFAYQG